MKSAGVLRSFHTSIVLRSAVIVMFVSGIIGYGLLGVITKFVEERVQETFTSRLGALVKTVENTAQIACYLSDMGLANEVSKGLLMSRDVERVIIRSEQGVLADNNRTSVLRESTSTKETRQEAATTGGASNATPATPSTGEIPPNAIVRSLTSPFKADTNVGEIIVVRNEAEIDAQVKTATNFIRLMITLQTGAIILVVTLIAVGYIAHPIHQISRRLNELSAVDGEKIDIPRGHSKNEIGQLVDDVNFLIDNLVSGINTERNLRMQREIEEKRFRAIFENAETGIFVIDHDGLLKSFNPSFRRILNIDAIDADKRDSISLLEISGDQAALIQEMIDDSLKEKRTISGEIKLINSDGNPRWLTMILNSVGENQLQGVTNDITDSKLREAHAHKLALTDALTGLGNRLGFEKQIEAMIEEREADPEQNFTMMMIDLDRFKQVNDTYGHDVGDIVLVQVARRIEQSIRKADFAARLGGDEFAVLLPYLADEEIVTRLAQTLVKNISLPIYTKTDIETSVGASIGISLVTGMLKNKEEIVKQADLALYAVKHGGRNGFRIYREDPAPVTNTHGTT